MRRARIRSGKKLHEVAGALAISKGSLSRIETRLQRPTAELAERLSRYFGTITELEILYPERYSAAGNEQERASA